MNDCEHDFVLMDPKSIVKGIKSGVWYDGFYVVCTKCFGVIIIKAVWL
jgi:hypothetical protein